LGRVEGESRKGLEEKGTKEKRWIGKKGRTVEGSERRGRKED